MIIVALISALLPIVVSSNENITRAIPHPKHGCSALTCTKEPSVCRCPRITQEAVSIAPDAMPCGQATNPFDPSLAAKGRVLVFYNAAQRRPVGLGNELLGFVSVFYEAMRASRAMMLENSGMIAKLKEVSQLGVPFATAAQLATKHEHKNRSANTAHNATRSSSSDFPVVFSKGNNVKLVRPKKWPYECYRAALKCPSMPGVGATASIGSVATPINQSSTDTSVISATIDAASATAANAVDEHETRSAYTCVERRALRNLILGVNPQLRALHPKLEQHWSGNQTRLKKLLAATAKSTEPIWQLALHARTQFGFVEAGLDERDPIAFEEAKNWTLDAGVQIVLAGIVRDIKAHLEKNQVLNHSTSEGMSSRGIGPRNKKSFEVANQGLGASAVYVASESLMARQHIAALLRAQGIEADYHTLQGTSHPATTDKVENRHPHGGHTFAAGKHARGIKAALGSGGDNLEMLRELSTEDDKCNACIFFLEWWALAQSRRVIARRGSELGVRRYPLWRFYDRWGVRPSSFAESALIYGGWE